MNDSAGRDAALDLDATHDGPVDGAGPPGAGRSSASVTPGAPAGASPSDGRPSAADRDAPRVLVDRYLLEERVASGGMASVWRAHDEVLARTVAVKVLHDHLAADEAFRERFRREAIAAAKLTHPNVVSLYDTGTDGDCVFIVMEYIDGSTLKDVIREQAPLGIPQATAIGERVARALDYAHSRGLVHRDVKPANILIGADGSVKVADFGIAKADHADDLTRTGMVLGTAAYVAPEQIRGEAVDGKADQYGLAIVLYEAITGRQPFKGDSPVATAAQRLERNPLPVRSLRADAPRALDAVLMRALARDPRDRFATVGAFADALAEFAEGDTGETAALVASTGGWVDDTAVTPRTSIGRAHSESFLRSEGRFLAPVLALLLLAGALVGVGLWTGVLEAGEDGFLPRIAGQEDDPETEAPSVADIPIAAPLVTYDPQGAGEERQQDLPLLLDGDESTSWRTERYRSAAFGNLKDGAGFYVDLGAPHAIDRVALRVTNGPATVEIAVADAPAPEREGWRTVGRIDDAGGDVIEVRAEEEAVGRYLLVWVTGTLPPFEGGYAAAFSQLAVFGAPG
jgi:eukaryotic-like serine/threonine-protein kinase